MTDSPSARSVRVDAVVPSHVEALFDARPDLMCTAPGGVTILKYHIQSFNPKLEVVGNTRGTAPTHGSRTHGPLSIPRRLGE